MTRIEFPAAVKREIQTNCADTCWKCGRKIFEIRADLESFGRRLMMQREVKPGDPETAELTTGEIYTLRAYAKIMYPGLAQLRGGKLSIEEFHHIVALEEGGSSTAENGAELCIPCHKEENKKHAARRSLKRSKASYRPYIPDELQAAQFKPRGFQK